MKSLYEVEAEKFLNLLREHKTVRQEIRIRQKIYDDFQAKIESVQMPKAIRFDTDKVSGTPTPKDTVVNILYSQQQDIEIDLAKAKAKKAAIENICELCSEETQCYIEDKFFNDYRWFELEEKYHYSSGAIRHRIASELELIAYQKSYDYERAFKACLREILKK